jgi:hypothetical protein
MLSCMERDSEQSESISCTSYFWIYTPDPADFEARRAISHLARAKTEAVIEHSSGEASDMLPYLEASNTLQSATARITRTLVGEARRRGVSWADIGKQFGVGATAAQKRFRDAENENRLTSPDEMHAADAVAVFNQAADLEAEGRLSEDELDLPPEWFLRVAVRKLVSTAFDFEDQVYASFKERVRHGGRFQMPQQWWEALGKARNELKSALWDLARTGVIGVVFDSGKYWPVKPYIDATPGLYLSYACFQGTLAVLRLADLVELIDADDLSGFFDAIEAAQTYQRNMVAAFARPECLAVIQVVNWLIDHESEEE